MTDSGATVADPETILCWIHPTAILMAEALAELNDDGYDPTEWGVAPLSHNVFAVYRAVGDSYERVGGVRCLDWRSIDRGVHWQPTVPGEMRVFDAMESAQAAVNFIRDRILARQAT